MRISWYSSVSTDLKILIFIEDRNWIASRLVIYVLMHVFFECRYLSCCLLLNPIKNIKKQMISSISFLLWILKNQWILWMFRNSWTIWKISLKKRSISICSRDSLLQNILHKDLRLSYKSMISPNYKQPKQRNNTSKLSTKSLQTLWMNRSFVKPLEVLRSAIMS